MSGLLEGGKGGLVGRVLIMSLKACKVCECVVWWCGVRWGVDSNEAE